MRKRFSFVIILALTAMAYLFPNRLPVAHARDFSKTFSVTGASAQQLSVILVAAGYQGGTDQVGSLTICVPDSNLNTLYVGQSNVSSSNGFPIPPGACDTISSTGTTVPVQTSTIYLWLATTEGESFQVHGQ